MTLVLNIIFHLLDCLNDLYKININEVAFILVGNKIELTKKREIMTNI